MNSLVIILAIFIISLIIMASFLIFRWRRLGNACYLQSMAKTASRKLDTDEYQAIESYLRNARLLMKPNSRHRADYPVLPVKHDDVYTITHPISRFSAATDGEHHWRYYLGETEIHLPVLFEPFIKQRNTIEIVRTSSIPLVIAVNGHFLQDYQQDLFITRVTVKTEHASIQKNGNSSAKLLHIRKETLEEYRLRKSTGIQGSVLMCVGLSLWFVALFVPIPMLPWLMLVAFLFILGGFWSHFRLPSSRKLANIHCFNGIPKRWGIFSEFEPEQRKNISLGGIDLVYPVHWEPYISHDLDQNTDIDIYTNCDVVRQGCYLSLHEEEKHYPYQRSRKNVMLVAFSVFVMLLLYFYQPVNLSMRLSFAWLYGSNTKVITSFYELQNMPLKEGDVLKVKGVGMCYVPPNIMPKANITIFAPFDCVGIYWNSEIPLPMLESEVVESASALITAVGEQLHPVERKSNPSLNAAIAKSGMTMLDNFSQIILKTQKLCQNDADCGRLKNALVNLGNAKSWDKLLKAAESGKLDGTKVLLRSISADALEKLVDSTTASFIYREIDKMVILINSPSPGGVLLLSDEGKTLVEYPMRTQYIYEHSALDRWRELQGLLELLMKTPFETEGIVTKLSEDPNGTRHIVLHREPDSTSIIRYLGGCLLLMILLVTLIINVILIIKKKQKNRRRLQHITQYYDSCFNKRNIHAEFRH
ncbi:IgaA/UmoB family intracellular growth attenuator [Xenorhabdus ehlersii]|uniref:intracellular growth attenuator protein IgaA n=2 Tax=Xenorhabdus ehlersii TaxID=290111 RepID=A0A2D0IUX1_9GAMM|nr:IgaA/UmoB family intracellular growth attenuator [Xenorhabdus ehlersii]PHM25676.1 Intracellular growth attenuator protein igaA [Xenorhabdus ehlersii]RKE93455.1 intracellular growth attenuator protein IgaA [Xenorhabdus ehlersii]